MAPVNRKYYIEGRGPAGGLSGHNDKHVDHIYNISYVRNRFWVCGTEKRQEVESKKREVRNSGFSYLLLPASSLLIPKPCALFLVP